jgi:hypothetical protein
MKAIFLAILLVAMPVTRSVAQTMNWPGSRHLPFECVEIAGIAPIYFERHGALALREYVPDLHVTVQASQFSKGTPWIDAQGNKITDFKIFWSYSKKDAAGDHPFLGLWHLRLSHYSATGDMKLSTADGGCSVDFHLRFWTSGANVIVVLPVDDAWERESTGRMELEYLDGISAELEKRKGTTPKPE